MDRLGILLLLIFFLKLPCASFAQKQKLEGIVFDSLQQPIPWVNIIDTSSGRGTYSDINGYFSFSVDSLSTLKFHAIGYQELLAKPDGQPMKIFLKKKAHRLATIEVRPPLKSGDISSWKAGKKKKWSSLSANPKFSFQAGVAFPNPLQIEAEIESITLYLKNNEVDTAYCKLHVYELNKDGAPDKSLLQQPVIISILRKRKYQKQSINLSSQHISIPQNGFLVALELINLPINQYQETREINGTSIVQTLLAPKLMLCMPENDQLKAWYKNEHVWLAPTPLSIEKTQKIPFFEVHFRY
ncbi:MAG: carboxypeptidase-like regulatory domain-containing protein [Saprospiraceae bacterium]|nr:carboxypeptidase-like regulatory domain-containing protein [Saprospiraceae bacterium]